MLRKIIFLLIFIYIAVHAQQLNNPQQSLNKNNKNFFIENKGQWDPEVKFLASIGGMNAWITNSGVVYDYYKITKNFDESNTLKMKPLEKRDYENKNTSIQGHIVKLQLVNAESNIIRVGNNQREGYYNYFIGNDKSKWASNVPLYDNIEIQGVYKGIDVKYYYDNGMLRYDFKAKPGADISQLKFKFEGQDGLYINTNGELVLKTSIGEVTNGKIYAYQNINGNQKQVDCRFEQKEDGTVGLNASQYDEKKELIIDPLVYSTIIYGSYGGTSEANCIAVDAAGNSYIVGSASSNYPTTTGAYQTSSADSRNYVCFVSKINKYGNALGYSTFIGGRYSDNGNDSTIYNNFYNVGTSIAVDSAGNAYITGYTISKYFPTTSGAFQTALRGKKDVFVTKLNSTGSSLIYSTLIGNNGDDIGSSIAIDKAGNAYLTGNADQGYPTTAGAYLSTGPGAFITKLNNDGSNLIYSTFIGNGTSKSIAVDADGNAYITGYTSSPGYPATNGAFQTAFKGSSDAFITGLNNKGNKLEFSTFLGGDQSNDGQSIAVDSSRNVYILGNTTSGNFPVTIGAYQTTLGYHGNIFVTKFNPDCSGLIYSTLIGGNSYTNAGTSMAIDKNNYVYFTGTASNSDFPVTENIYDASLYDPGSNTAIITKLNKTGSQILSTYLNGQGNDGGTSIALDSDNNVYVTGYTYSLSFPTTVGTYQQWPNGYGSLFVAKYQFLQIPVPTNVQQIYPVKDSLIYVQPIVFSWEPIFRGVYYRFQLSTDSSFSSVIVDTSKLVDTTFGVVGLKKQTTYYWRINGENFNGTSPWSEVWKFKTLGSPTSPVAIYPPVNGTSIPLKIRFEWSKSVDQLPLVNIIKNKKQNIFTLPGINKTTQVNSYWMQLLTDTTTTLYIINDNSITDTAKLVDGLSSNTSYFWRIRGMNESGWGKYSGWNKFTTITDTPSVAVLVSPNSNLNIPDTVKNILFTWNKSQNAESYELLASSDENFSQILIDSSAVTDTLLNVNAGRFTPTFYWKVRGSNGLGFGHWSSIMAVSFITGIDKIESVLPTVYKLNQNYPNPFNPTTIIKYDMPESGFVSLKVYDILGREVQTLVNGNKIKGTYEVSFNGSNLASGVYLYKLKAGNFTSIKKMLLIK